MKKLFRLMTFALVSLLALASCEDVPMPYPTPNAGTEEEGGSNNEHPIEAVGDGTLATPFNVAAAVEFIKNLGADIESSQEVYIKGKVKANSTTESTINQYGNMTFTMIDEGNDAITFMAFQVYGPGKKKFTAVSQIKEGDEVVVCGKVVNYKGNTPETVGKGSAYVYAINGISDDNGDTPQQPDQPTGGDAKGDGTQTNPYNVAAIINMASSLAEGTNSDVVYFKGIVSSTKDISAQYGNATFYISEDGKPNNEFYIYRCMGLNNEKISSANDVKVGDEVVICGKVTNFKGNTPETVQGEAYIFSLNRPGGDTDEGGNGDVTPGDASEYDNSISYTKGESFYDNGMATVNGVQNVQTLKIGTSSKPGDFTIIAPASGKLCFYAVTWKGAGSATVKFIDGATEVATQAVKANDGATGNAPYTLTVNNSDKYEVSLPAGKQIKITADKRIIFFGMK